MTTSAAPETGSDHPQREPLTRLLVLVASMKGQLTHWNRMAQAASDAETLHDNEFVRSGRIREQCVADLRSQGMAQTRAEKEASDHEIYTSYKDNLAKLATAKRETALDRDVAQAYLECAKIEVNAQTAAVNVLAMFMIDEATPKVSHQRERFTDEDAIELVKRLRNLAKQATGSGAPFDFADERVAPGTPDARD